MKIEIPVRDKFILSAIIQEYISTGEPVGSRVLSKKYGLDISAATIRNVMSDLEEIGFLQQPHISAGRIPTPEGFRCYLEGLDKFKDLSSKDRTFISRNMSATESGIEPILNSASHLLSEISKNASIVILPKLSAFILKNVEFIRINPSKILVIMVSRAGMVYSHTIQGDDITQGDLFKYGNYLNETYSGMTIQQMRDLLVQEMNSDKARFDEIVMSASKLGILALNAVDNSADIYMDGKESVFDYPEITDIEKLKEIVKAFEDKGRMLKLLNRVLESQGVKVYIGNEMDQLGVNDFSMVASGYCRQGAPVGTLGVIGPIRMDYSKVIPLVEYMAFVLGNLLEDM